MSFKDRIVSLVPGIKDTNFGKKIEIGKYVKEYSVLIQERETVDAQIAKSEESLGLVVKPTKNIDELASEEKRLTDLQIKLQSIYSKGKEDPSQLSEDELLTFQILEERENSKKTSDLLTINILAIRQGLMNVADPENSTLNGDLKNKYINPDKFIKHSSYERLLDFLNACKRTGVLALPDLTKKDVTDLVVSNGTSPEAKKLIEASPMLKIFVEKLYEVCEKTGYSTGKYPIIPFNFEEGRLDGEIKITEAPLADKSIEFTKNA